MRFIGLFGNSMRIFIIICIDLQGALVNLNDKVLIFSKIRTFSNACVMQSIRRQLRHIQGLKCITSCHIYCFATNKYILSYPFALKKKVGIQLVKHMSASFRRCYFFPRALVFASIPKFGQIKRGNAEYVYSDF